MRIYYCDHFVLPLPDGHRFPMAKYSRLRERVASAGLGEMRVPDGATDEELRRVHTAEYVGSVVSGALDPAEVRRIGFPWSEGLVERSRRSVGGTLGAGRAALDEGVGVNLAGGTHHAFADRGEGFCVFNDVAVAVRALQSEGRIERAVVLDLDVHQGNGTAALFRDDPTVFTLSVHGEKNYPFTKEDSDLDVTLPDGTGDLDYLAATEEGVSRAIRASDADIAFFVAGADPYEGDKLGRLSLTKAGLASRDALVFRHCRERGIPVAVVMSGGYAPEIEDIVDIHFETVRQAASWAETPTEVQ